MNPASVEPTYRLPLGQSTEYRLWARDRDDRFPFILGIFRDEGGWEPSQLDGFETDSYLPGDSSASELITRLYDAAARSATGADRMLAELMNELDQVDPDSDMPF